MQYQQLGKSGLRISRLTMGTMSFGGGGKFSNVGTTDTQDATRILDICRDRGINLVDTADVYSDGLSETIVGEAIKNSRDHWLVATKVRFRLAGASVNDVGLSRHHIIRSLERSLERLQTDHIDLYQVHQWDGQTPLEETLSALDTLVKQGKIRYIGASNYSGWQLMKALATSDAKGLSRFTSEQIHYSLQSRDAEFELLPAAHDQGLGVLVWSPLAGGLLSGKYSRAQDGSVAGPKGARQMSEWSEPPIYEGEKLFRILDVLWEIAGAHGVSPAQMALAWLLNRPAVTSLVIGARTSQQLEDNLAAVDIELTDEEAHRLESVSRPNLLYPYWHQRDNATDRLSAADAVLLGPYLNATRRSNMA
ncbi:aldo/keto reductase [Mycolicibacterium stellerae]|uniref:aldo/keto reductase n=1 Tax=Mycolicibacterium stellerae TaxID=2358193 RepID=UPI000F0BB2B4|nr:aldo/keto reductase [Mycolicibacterium stellerae]